MGMVKQAAYELPVENSGYEVNAFVSIDFHYFEVNIQELI